MRFFLGPFSSHKNFGLWSGRRRTEYGKMAVVCGRPLALCFTKFMQDFENTFKYCFFPIDDNNFKETEADPNTSLLANSSAANFPFGRSQTGME